MAQPNNEPIAIVGSACRYAGGATSPAKLWELLKDPKDVSQNLSTGRFNVEGFYHKNHQHHGHTNVKRAYLLDDHPGMFDAQFFGVKPIEAKALDPQQRLLLEIVYEGLEAAGIPLEKLRGSDTGVYVGVMSNDYEQLMLRDSDAMATYHTVGTQRSIIANRVSYFFDWHGPSMVIDTACSSSLVAVHLAVQALRTGDAKVAVACGSNVLLGPENYIGYSKLKMLSPDGKSQMWDESANGYARGEGVAAIILKPLSQALKDGDHVECIIRETGTNQDGTTPGLTMPSPNAQLALIRETYRRAGLRLEEGEGCQYFEAHGTGTPAGDPVEAEAIAKAFASGFADTREKLLVGSVKTVIGHTEGTAGIASILKTSMALQNGEIPPNMSFESLNPMIEPFYTHMRVPTQLEKWPALSKDEVRRASVNSFGFGGANAHAILEQPKPTPAPLKEGRPLVTPFVFSASSKKSLAANLAQYSQWLEQNKAVDIHDLAYTLRSRRSVLPFKCAVEAESAETLRSKILELLQSPGDSPATGVVGLKAKRTLGIFTGQGAQYAGMAAELLQKSEFAQKLIQHLEDTLSSLPESDRPTWSLKSELLEIEKSRNAEAAISQPLCTAIQILLVALLRLAGVTFGGVVGHSSGEIAAAYAAGYLSSRDAMRIAYYRGLHCKSDSSVKGAMLAVGMSFEDAKALCREEEIVGKVVVAASNSTNSCTLSGDVDGIARVEELLSKSGTFHRRLRVDQAYHSHHMVSCAEKYLESLRNCHIEVLQPTPGCEWMSTTYGEQLADTKELSGIYWVKNMTQPVLFSQALDSILSQSSYNLVLEVGPHPALKAPSTQLIRDTVPDGLPYYGLLDRNERAIKSVSNTLGHLWCLLGPSVDLDKYEKAVSGVSTIRLVKNLPTYQWDHDRVHWHEGRISRKTLTHRGPWNILLGHATTDSAPNCLSWRNRLRVGELPWLSGHQLQGQTIFPAAGYLATAIEASKHLQDGKNARLIEVRNVVIHHPIILDDSSDVEVLTTLNQILELTKTRRKAHFSYSADLGKNQNSLTLVASCVVEIELGEPSPAALPTSSRQSSNMVQVDTDRFYSSLSQIGYNYSNQFRSLFSLSRKLDRVEGFITASASGTDEAEKALLLHPAVLDSAIQSILLAYSYPGDGRLAAIHVPTSIDRICVNPELCEGKQDDLPFDSSSQVTLPASLSGGATIYNKRSTHAAVQLEGIKLVPLATASPADDRNIFSRLRWVDLTPDAELAAQEYGIDDVSLTFAETLERIAIFYLRKFDTETENDHPARSDTALGSYLQFARHVTELVRNGKHPYAKKEWMEDTIYDVLRISESFAATPDVRIMHTIGEQMSRVFDGHTNILEHTRPSGVLNEYYVNALGIPSNTQCTAHTVAQLTHRYPQMQILEIGAGTGGATKSVLREVQSAFSSYDFTDVSRGFFEDAEITFQEHLSKMSFKVLDIERDPVEQGFEAHSYDLVIASFVIHATSSLETAVSNARQLLKAGGYLVMAEITDNEQSRTPFIFGTLPGWWVGVGDGRTMSPCVSSEKWDNILASTGFSGIDTITPDSFKEIHPFSVIVSQAIDQRVTFLRSPLLNMTSAVVPGRPLDHLVIIAGKGLRAAKLAKSLQNILSPISQKTTVYTEVRDVDYDLVDADATVISLVDLGEPIFKHLTESDFLGLQRLFGREKTIVWFTKGRRSAEPFSNMMVGFGRTAVCEVPELRVQFIDVESDSIDATILSNCVLRFEMEKRWIGADGSNDMLWSVELELILDTNGRQLAARMEPLPSANTRYNSCRRLITQKISDKSSIFIEQDRSGWFLSDSLRLPSSSEDTAVLASYATLHRLATPFGLRFLAVGRNLQRESKTFVMSESLTPVVNGRAGEMWALSSTSEVDDAHLLSIMTSATTTAVVLSTMKPSQTLLVWGAEPSLAPLLSCLAKQRGVKLVLAGRTDYTNAPGGVTVPDYSTSASITKALANMKYDCFLGLSSDEYEAQKHESAIIECLWSGCRVETAKSLLGSSRSSVFAGISSTFQSLMDVAVCSLNDVRALDAPPEIISVAEATTVGAFCHNSALLNWSTLSLESCSRVKNLGSTIFFNPDRTYWLAGLSGTLGLSLCDWMVDQGAKHIVISSRTPNVDATWLEAHKKNGAEIIVAANDITNYNSVQALFKRIQDTLPPLAGVAQGAMVLRDASLRDMTFAQMTEGLQPKVDGSLNLDRVLGNAQLDFMVFFSSILGITGNVGQANYTAANAFMNGLAANRRKRGLAASVVNIGVILGVGFVTREISTSQEGALSRGGLMTLSEVEMREIFAEGINASAVGSGEEMDIAVGFGWIQTNASYIPSWRRDPKFARYLIEPIEDSTARGSSQGLTASLEERLQAAQNLEETRMILGDALSTRLRVLLQMDTSTDEMLKMRTDEIGLDSLVAVDVRSWLSQNLGLDIPVLKLLGGIPISELVNEALSSMELTQNETDSNDTSETDEIPTPPTDASPIDSPNSPGSENAKETQKRDLQRSLPMSFTQSLFWAVDSLVDNKTAPNHTVLMRIIGSPRLSELRNAISVVGRHHEALRTCFYADEDQKPMQGILQSPTLELEHIHVLGEHDVVREFEQLKTHVYSLATGHLMRIVLLTQDEITNWLLIGFHHINVDGLSYQALVRNLDTICRGQILNPTIQYADFAMEQRALYESGKWAESIEFWKQEFSTIPEPLPLTRARLTSRPPVREFAIRTNHIRVDTTTSKRIREVARANKATSFHFYLSCMQVLIHRLTGAEDFAIGIADGGRNRSGSQNNAESIGPYVNLVPLRFDVTSSTTFGRLMADSRGKSYAALAHSHVPFDVLLNELKVTRTLAHNPIFQSFLDYRSGAQERQSLGKCSLEMMELQMGSTGYDLSLDVIDNPEGDALISVMTQPMLYSEEDTRIITNMLQDILQEFIESPSKRISENWQYRQADVEKAVKLGEGAFEERKWPHTLIERFQDVARSSLNKVALVHADGSRLTYAQMQNRLNVIAKALVNTQVVPGDSVGVFQESTPDWICSMLAIWKVGAVFVPLDAGTATERLAMIVTDCKPKVILVDSTTNSNYSKLEAAEAVSINVSELNGSELLGDVGVRAIAEGLAMVYYTSGSTGNPKGIPVIHEGLRAVFEGSCQHYGVNEDTVSLLQSSLGFDIILIQMFISWSVGGRVCMISRDLRGDSTNLADFIIKNNITHTAGTPSEYNSWLRFADLAALQSSAWKIAICGAEAFPMVLLDRLREMNKPDLQLFHIYGTTETTIYATQEELDWKTPDFYKPGAVPAGISLPNKVMYIVDEELHLIPPGFPGEIILGGVGVSGGYNNAATKSESSFVPNTFAAEGSYLLRNGWTTMYRTRDRGRLLPNGSIQVEGRIGDSTEIKLRGQRIDLKDIEQTIILCSGGVLTEAVASIRSTAGSDTQFLVAHAVFSSVMPPVAMKEFTYKLLAQLPLPRYMCPAVIVPIEKMPLTMSSKLDRRAAAALPILVSDVSDAAEQVEELTSEEMQLKDIWQEVIGQSFDITANSDFFHVGGTSLLLVQLQVSLRKRFGVKLRLADLFSNSILRSMFSLIAVKSGNAENMSRGMTIDWEWETRPSAQLRIGTSTANPPAEHPKSIVITGGAGFLGRSLLKSAINNPKIERIHAVAVRRLEERLASGLLPTHPKLIYYDGDLREPQIGLSDKDVEYIFNDADAVVHNGADVSHLKSYFTLRRANLNATKELSRLCLPRRIPFHYVSTAGVSMFTFWQSFGEETASAAEPPTDGTNGYKASKWASERYLERLNAQLKLPMWMHRPSDMVRQDDEEASWDLLHTLLGYSRKLRAVPLSENLWGWLDLVAVSSVSNDVIQMVHDNKPRCVDGGVSYVHQTGDMAIPIDEMKEFFEEECEYAYVFEKLPIEEWAKRAEVAGMRSAVAAVFGNVPKLARALCFPRFIKTWRPDEGQDGGMLLLRKCPCGGTISPVWGEGCAACGNPPSMPVWS